jgi:flavorubredoxin
MHNPYQAMPGIEVLPVYFPILNIGVLPVNAFVIKAKEPVLVDTGIAIESDAFMKALESVIDPKDLKWVWLTHDDADHTGSIRKVLEAAPSARLAANSLAVIRMSTTWQVPMPRIYWLNSGDSISVGDRTLTAVRPPLFDNPTTIGVYDDKSEVFFSADCFGAILPSPVQNADDVTEEVLAQGMITWASADAPWVYLTDTSKFARALDTIRHIAPKIILSGHLPMARGKTEQLLKLLATVPASPPFVAPGQTVLEQIVAQMRQGG